MRSYLLAIDQGTTGTTALVLSSALEVLGAATVDIPQHFPREGWVEHDAHDTWASVRSSVQQALQLAGVSPQHCEAIGITNQRETTVLWDRATHQPVHRAIVWQDRRTSSRCAELAARGEEAWVRGRTGLLLDPYFSATKLEWLLNQGDYRARAERGQLCFGTIDSYLLYQLTSGAVHATDVSNASRTMLFDIHQRRWDEDLCELFSVPRAVLPRVVATSEVVGTTAGLDFLPDGIPIAALVGDQQSALFGQACFLPGEAKCTYGTGAFLVLNTGPTPVESNHRLLTTVAWSIDGQVTYALEGSAFVAGAAVQWLRDGLGLIHKSADVETLARSVSDSAGVVFVPALTGLGAPYWDADARGVLTGLTRATTAAHIARATLDAIAYQVMDLVKCMQSDTRQPLQSLRVDGGACANDLLMQIQADMLGIPVLRPRNLESTSIGAACLAGLAVKVFSGLDDVRRALSLQKTFEPEISAAARNHRQAQWSLAVCRARSTIDDPHA
jgi:glycerol kinase